MRTWLVLALACPILLAAEGADWQVGLATTDITPTEPLPMAGYAAREAPFESVADPLFAKALAIQDENGGRALLITADLLGFTRERSEAICARLQESTGIQREQVILNASHTHAGPLVAGSLLTRAAPATRREIDRYIQEMESKIVAAGQQALRSLRPAHLAWGRGVAPFVMNRREFTERGVILGTNASGLADRTVPVLRVSSPDGELRAVVFGAGSHCTTLTGGNLKISGDYAGIAQGLLEESMDGVQAMFMTGCAGDANPHPRGTLDLARRHGANWLRSFQEYLKGNSPPCADRCAPNSARSSCLFGGTRGSKSRQCKPERARTGDSLPMAHSRSWTGESHCFGPMPHRSRCGSSGRI